jgi:hypothetical protein
MAQAGKSAGQAAEEVKDPFDFSDIKTPDELKAQSEHPHTLEQLLYGCSPLGEEWTGAYYRSPKTRHLKRLLAACNALEGLEEDDAVEKTVGILCTLVRVEEGGKLRRALPDEILDMYDPGEIADMLFRVLKKDGLAEDNAGNAEGNRTGSISTGDAETGSPA